MSGRAEETLQQPGKGETVTSGRGRTDGPHRRKRNKGSDVEGADVMSLRKVTRVGETRAGEKAIREYRRKKQQRRGGRESNRKIEIPSAGGARFLLRGIFRAVTRYPVFHKANWLSRIVSF